MREKMLSLIHESHLGIQKMKSRANQLLFWPGISADIDRLSEQCELCQKYRSRSQKEPLITHEIPSIPWNKIGCDILEYQGKNFLVAVDYYSKWIELKQLRAKKSADIIEAWTEMFASFGLPRIIIADNVPFNSFECKQFAQKFDITIITSSPLYPKSNGLAERAVQICKNILKKNETSAERLNALLIYVYSCKKFVVYSVSIVTKQTVENESAGSSGSLRT